MVKTEHRTKILALFYRWVSISSLRSRKALKIWLNYAEEVYIWICAMDYDGPREITVDYWSMETRSVECLSAYTSYAYFSIYITEYRVLITLCIDVLYVHAKKSIYVTISLAWAWFCFMSMCMCVFFFSLSLLTSFAVKFQQSTKTMPSKQSRTD